MDLIDIDKVLDEFEASEYAKTICPQKARHDAKKVHEEEWLRNKAEFHPEKTCVSIAEDPPNDDGVVNQENNLIFLHGTNDKVDGAIFEQDYHNGETKIIDHLPDIESQNNRTTNEMAIHDVDIPGALPTPAFTDRELTEEELNAYLADIDVNDAEISRIFENLATLTHVDQILDENLICDGDSSMSVNEINGYENQQIAKTSATQNDETACVGDITTVEDGDSRLKVACTYEHSCSWWNPYYEKNQGIRAAKVTTPRETTVAIQAEESQVASASQGIEINVTDSPDVTLYATVETQLACEIADVSYENDHFAIEQSGGSLVTIKHISDEISDPWKPTESELQLGEVEPIWIPDQDSNICMLCELKFTLIKRRHHCRACGRVLCLECCNIKRKLAYSENLRDVRICTSCNERLNRKYKKALTTTTSGTKDASVALLPPDSDENAPVDAGNVNQSLLPSVLDTPADSGAPLAPSSKREHKRVIFSDGIKPGFGQIQYFADEYESGSASQHNASESAESTVVCFALPTRSKFTDTRTHELCSFSSQLDRYSLYPIIKDGTIMGYVKDQYLAELFQIVSDTQRYEVPDQTEADSSTIVKFALKLNLSVAVKRVCVKVCRESQYLWCFASRGLKNVCADEILIILAEDIPDENEETKFTSNVLLHYCCPKIHSLLGC
uniref:FYVE-type domain-containing protein n=1 Tax=Romanomermis culicivorax TaxID=13658 RepID=A0A915K5I3_ROMCU